MECCILSSACKNEGRDGTEWNENEIKVKRGEERKEREGKKRKRREEKIRLE